MRGRPRLWLGRDRLYYGGLVGHAMKPRRLGALILYAAPAQGIEISVAGGPWRRCSLAAVAPYVPHRLRTASGEIATLGLEPESLDRAELAALIARAEAQDETLIRRLAAPAAPGGDGFSTAAFDLSLFGQALKGRALDPRIRGALDAMIDDGPGSAEACAACAGVSVSRFLHLFKQETDIAFRRARVWKRARRFLDHAHRDESLTEVALDLGYPDSSHFSRSIRACYGLQPRSIRQGSRGMTVSLGENYAFSQRG